MKLSPPVRILVGVITLIVFLIPIGSVIGFLFSAIALINLDPSYSPGQIFGPAYNLMYSDTILYETILLCLSVFYVTHIIKNTIGTDVIRIISTLAIFFVPPLGMLFYYCLFILMSKPPAWATKTQNTSEV